MANRDSTAGRGGAATLIAGLIAGVVLLAISISFGPITVDRAAADGPERRDLTGDPAAPASPIGDPERQARGNGLEITPAGLLAGRSGQELRVSLSEPLPGPAILLLTRVRRDDPRHPGSKTGGETVLERNLQSGTRGISLEGLAPQPGPHRILVEAEGRRIASGSFEVLPQAHRSLRTEPERKPRARSAAPQTNAQVAGEVNHDLSFRPGSEFGSAVALDQSDPARGLIATDVADGSPLFFQSDDSFTPAEAVERSLPSTALLPDSSTVAIDPCCDPDTAADDAGNLWGAATETGGPGGRILVARVPSGSRNFVSMAASLPVHPAAELQSKPSIAVAPGDRVAVGWIETAGGLQNLVVSQCDISGPVSQCDNPALWSDPVPVTGTGGLYPTGDLAFGPNGDLLAVWWDAGPDNAIEINRCLDGEDCSDQASWDEEAAIDNLDSFDDDGIGGDDPLPLFCPIIGAPGGLVNPSPSVAIGPLGTIYVGFSDLRDNRDPTEPTRCTASGSDSTWDSFVAAGIAPGSFPATDSGTRISGDGELDLNDHFLPALSVDQSSGEVETSYFSTVEDPGGQTARRFYTASADAGLTYSSPAPIATDESRFAGTLSDGIDYGSRQGSASSSGSFKAAWTDSRGQQGRDPDLYTTGPALPVTIESAPSGTVAENSAAVLFSSAAIRTECSIDGRTPVTCTSPLSLSRLKNKDHSVSIRSTDPAGNPVDLGPALASWTVLDLTPPETTLVSGPKARTRDKRPEFVFASNDPTAKFECSYDKEPWRVCSSPKNKKVDVGKHRFRVRAKDVAGNVDRSAIKVKFKRKARCKTVVKKKKSGKRVKKKKCKPAKKDRKKNRRR